MVTLNIQASGKPLGDISDNDFRLLQSVLEEEGPGDSVDLDTIDLIASRGGSEQLLALLRNAVAGTPEGVEISFQQSSRAEL